MNDIQVDVVWVPLGLGPHGALVRWSGRAYEAAVAARQHRVRRALYHSALVVLADEVTTRIELAVPVQRADRGIVAEGPVGARFLSRLSWFRYEVRCWTDSPMPDVPPALGGPVCVSTDPTEARRILALVPEFPLCTWGRDEQRAGEMWNSNSLISWLLARAGVATDGIVPPLGGRAPGWDAGLTIAARSQEHSGA